MKEMVTGLRIVTITVHRPTYGTKEKSAKLHVMTRTIEAKAKEIPRGKYTKSTTRRKSSCSTRQQVSSIQSRDDCIVKEGAFV